MNLFSHARLRTRLMLLALVAVFPAVIVIGYTASIERSHARERMLEDNLRLTRLAASQQAGVFAGVHRLLLTLAQLPVLRERDPRPCNALLPNILREHPGYLNLAVVNADGSPFCAAAPLDSMLSGSDRAWLQRALQTRTTALGDDISSTSRTPAIVLAQPLLDASGAVERLIVALLDLDQLKWMVFPATLPQGATLTLFDRNGMILARYPDPGRWVGRPLPEWPSVESRFAGARAGTIEAAGVDGVRRLYRRVSVDAGFDTGLSVRLGIEPAAAFAKADQILRQQLWLLGFVLLAALGVALIGGHVFVLRPIGTLRSSLDRLAAGDLSVRAVLAAGAPGLSELGSAVNAMAIALEARQRERDHADVVLRTLSTALEQAPENVIVTDRDGRIEYVNAAFETLTGYARAEAIGQTPRILKAVGKYKQDFYERLWQTILAGGVFEDVLLNQKKNGDLYYEEKTIAPVRDVHGTITHFVSTGKDITERQRASVALKASEAKFHLIMENTPSAVFIHSGNRFVYANMAAERLTGYTRDELLAMSFWQIVHPDFRDLARDRGLARQHGDDVPSRYELKISTKAGEERWVDITAARTVFDGEWSGLATVFDITQQKETAQALLTSEAQLRQSQKMDAVGQLAGGIAHDFNNLLTVINGMAELGLAQVREGDQLHEDLQEIYRAGARAAALTRQLLAFSRKQILQPQVMNLNTVVAEMESLLRRLIGEDIDLVVMPTPGLGNVKADLGQIEQVIANLVINARDAMPQGGQLTIETRNVEIDEQYARQHGVAVQPGPHVMLAISDTGVGMDEVTRARIFEPFFTTKGPGKGTGLGLSTVYGIVKQSDGFIWAYSEVGQGTSFKIYLPRIAERVGSKRPGSTVTPAHGTETILVVEDVEGLCKLAKRMLESAGYTVFTAANGEEALRLLERDKEPVHLMVTDIVMPGMSGPNLAKRLGRTAPRTKVLYMSGYTDDIIVRHGALDARMPFLSKPFTVVELTRKVREVLDSQS